MENVLLTKTWSEKSRSASNGDEVSLIGLERMSVFISNFRKIKR